MQKIAITSCYKKNPYGRHHSPRRTGTSGHTGLMRRAGEVEKVGLTGALTSHAPSRLEDVTPLGAALVDLTSRTQPVCATQRKVY